MARLEATCARDASLELRQQVESDFAVGGEHGVDGGLAEVRQGPHAVVVHLSRSGFNVGAKVEGG